MDLGEDVEAGHVDDLGAERRRFVGDGEEGQGGRRPLDRRFASGGLRGLLRYVDDMASALPFAVMALDQSGQRPPVVIADHQEGDVLGAVEPAEELEAVLVHRRHRLDVLEESDGRVLVRVDVIGGVLELLEESGEWIDGALVVLAEDRPRFLLELFFRVFQVLESVGFDLHDLRKRSGAREDVVDGAIDAGVGVGVGAHGAKNLVVPVLGIRLRPAEHHVLEEVSEAGAALFDLVARAHAHHAVVGGKARAVEAHPDELQPIGEVLDVDRVGEDFSSPGGGGDG